MIHRLVGGIFIDSPNVCEDNTTIEKLAPPPRALYPLRSSDNTVYTPLVASGATVKVGQKIAADIQGSGAGICATISGSVSLISNACENDVQSIASICIESDTKDLYYTECKALSKDAYAKPQQIIDQVQKACITDAGSDVSTIIQKAKQHGSCTLIIQGLDMPYSKSFTNLTKAYPEEILKGIKLLMIACNAATAKFAISRKQKTLIKMLRQRSPETVGIHIAPISEKYPQAAARPLIQTITGEKIPADMPSTAFGYLVLSVSAAYHVYRAVYEGQPMTEELVTVSGSVMPKVHNYWIRIGTPMSYLLQHLHLNQESSSFGYWINFAPTNKKSRDLSVPITQETHSIFFSSEEAKKAANQTACIRCGRCHSVCPIRLYPMQLHLYAQHDAWEQMKTLGIMDCISCGCCTYICPAKLPLSQVFDVKQRELRQGGNIQTCYADNERSGCL